MSDARRFETLILVLVVGASLGLLVACGSGGGGSTPGQPTQPGVLRTLALEGGVAPDGGGSFGAFPTAVPLAAAKGGWSLFVGETTLRGQVAYVALPDGSLLRVWAEGDPAPDLVDGTISAIDRVWIVEGGRLLALVEISGNGAGILEGLLSARVVGGAVTDRRVVIYDPRSMADTDVAGDLVEIDPDNTYLATTGEVFFRGGTTTPETAFWKVRSDGSALSAVVATGDALPGGTSVAVVHATGIDAAGTRFAFVAERSDGGGIDAIYTGTVGSALFGEVAAAGDDLFPPETIDSIPHDQPLLVYAGNAATTVIYKAVSTAGEDYLLFGIPDERDFAIAREGGTDTSVTGGTFGALAWLRNEAGAATPMFRAALSGASSGIHFGIFSLEGLEFQTAKVTLALAVFDGRPAPNRSGVVLSASFPGLGANGTQDASREGSLAFANVLSQGGETSLYWLVRQVGFFETAGAGIPIPGGGDRFGGASSYRSTTAVGVVLFRAPLESGGSGVFRRGP
ncbi:MAG: hypothetical protein ACC662_06120 [Planctomycetota bacterium]